MKSGGQLVRCEQCLLWRDQPLGHAERVEAAVRLGAAGTDALSTYSTSDPARISQLMDSLTPEANRVEASEAGVSGRPAASDADAVPNELRKDGSSLLGFFAPGALLRKTTRRLCGTL